MLFRKHIFSTRTILQLSTAIMVLVNGAGAAYAANSGVAPVLVPYVIVDVAGNEQPTTANGPPSSGFGGDGGAALSAAMNGPAVAAIDSVGNVYIADTGNAVIREVNAQTGVIKIIAGVSPSSCSGTTCGKTTSGCADGVPALNDPIGPKINGIAVDAYGNVYFDDATQFTVRVIYRGGAQVANFISLEDPTAAPTPSAVKPGYVYHIGGTISLTSCAGTKGNTDKALAFQGSSLNAPGQIGLDSAGNIYIQDIGNSSVRVINTQATTQTFPFFVPGPAPVPPATTSPPTYSEAVPPGYMWAILDCSAALTVSCPSIVTTTQGTGIGGPGAMATFNTVTGMGVDAYGNIYQVNNKGATPGLYAAVAYAGGAPLAKLLTVEGLTGVSAPNPLVVTSGDWYEVINNITINTSLPTFWTGVDANCCGAAAAGGGIEIRPTAINADFLGNIWYLDNHYPELERIDVNSQISVDIVGWGAGAGGTKQQRSGQDNSGKYASFTNPEYCVQGPTAATAFTQGPQYFDVRADGCPAILGETSGNGFLIADGLGDIYNDDPSYNEIREFLLDNAFPATKVGTSVTQAIQVHFDSTNNPVQVGAAPNTSTTSFSIAPGIADFKIDTTDPELPIGLQVNSVYATAGPTNLANNTLSLYAGQPSCTAFGAAANDTGLDCLVYVTFTPGAPGLRAGQLAVTTANGSKYNFSLSGVGTAGSLAIDGGTQTVVSTTGLGATAGIAVTQSGVVYIADPANNRVVVEPAGGGTQTTIGTGLKGPMGVAVDTANNVYIADTGNNRILQVNPITGAQTVLGAILATGSPAYPAYVFKAPQGVAVDTYGNVYVADTGNAAIVEIPLMGNLGGATPLFQYNGAPTFVTPVGVAVDAKNNIYVADTGNPFQQVVEIPPGGGDLQTILPSGSHLPLIGGNGISTPNGVAVDGAGDVFISDSGSNVVWEAPAAGPPNGNPFTLSFSGLSSPAGLALDANGNLYVADSGNKQVLFMNRQNPIVSFGTVPQSLATASGVAGTPAGCPVNGSSTPCTGVLTVTNSGNSTVTLSSPLTTVTSVSPTGDTAFGISNTCGATLLSGATCTIAPTFFPTSNGPQAENVDVNGTNSMALVANETAIGEQPLVNITQAVTSPAGGPVVGQTATITATVTQPHIPGNTPTGNVLFTYLINGVATSSCGTGGSQTVALLSGSGGTATASITLPVLLQGRQYTVNATYQPNGDTSNSLTLAAPLSFYIPGVAVTATAASATYVYGAAVPKISGTVTGITDTSVTATFTTAATSSTPIGIYPITVVFAGGTFCNYGFPQVVNPGTTTAATVTETAAALTVVLPAYTTVYGAPDLNYATQMVITGAVNGDQNRLSATFTPAHSSILNVINSPFVVVPTLTGKPIGNYTVKITNGTLTVSTAPSGISATLKATSTLPANLAAATIQLAAATTVAGGGGTPSGTITVYDTLTPITPTAPGLGSVVLPCSIPFVGATTSGSPTVTGVANPYDLAVGQQITSAIFPTGTTISSIGVIGTGTVTLSASATATVPAVLVTAATGAATCNAPVTLPLSGGLVPFIPTNATLGLHQFVYAYSGDSNFQPSAVIPSATAVACAVQAISANCLLVDDADFAVSSTTSPLAVIPGCVPSGNGLLAAPGQGGSCPQQSAAITITSVLSETGVVSLSCLPIGNPYSTPVITPPAGAGTISSYIQCSMTPPNVTLTANGSQVTVFSVSTPATEPLNYNFFSQVRMPGSETMLAFLPLGVLAFCMRRRRRLSKALWVLLAIAAVTAGMSGCGGNQVDFYAPIPQGPQYVSVTATGTNLTTGTQVSRTFVVPIFID